MTAQASAEVSLPALHEVLSLAARAALLAESGDMSAALLVLRDADRAADEVFPQGSPEACALETILGVITGGGGCDEDK